MTVTIDGNRLIEELEAIGKIGRNDLGGYDRLAFNREDFEARTLVEEFMREAGMMVVRDAACNSVGSYPGSEDLPPIVIGSHTDSVPCGGNYDGVLGVLSGIACIRALHESKTVLRHPVEIINFSGEEAVAPGGTFGSRLMTGGFDAKLLQQITYNGKKFENLLSDAGVNIDEIYSIERTSEDVAAYLELHIEQGGILDQKNIPVGVVEGIVGFRRYKVMFKGFANHAGTTPMDQRDDALVKAAPFVLSVERVARKYKIVGTVGTFEVGPGAPNVIPDSVVLTFELRGLDDTILDSAEQELRRELVSYGAAIECYSCKPPIISDPLLVELLGLACEESSLQFLQMPSGAGHDANLMARICPVAMLFVANKDGISHSKDEYTAPENCIKGATALLNGLLKIDTAI